MKIVAAVNSHMHHEKHAPCKPPAQFYSQVNAGPVTQTASVLVPLWNSGVPSRLMIQKVTTKIVIGYL
jgi:hypothetical protein